MPNMPHMPRMPNIPRLPKLPEIPSCLPTAHIHKNHTEGSPLDVLDTHTERPDGVHVLNRHGSTSSEGPTNNFFARWPDGFRGHTIAMLAELVGTTAFLFFGFAAAQVANEKDDTLAADGGSDPSLLQITYIAATFGISLAVNVWIFYRVSGGMFNPAVALGLWLAGAFSWVRLVCVIPMQFLGGILAAGLVAAMFPGDLQAASTLSSSTSPAQGFFIEMMITSELVMTIIMLAVVKSRASFMAPLSIGLALFIGHMIGINFTGASMNPARTLGPAVVGSGLESYSWIYFIGPAIGSIFAAGLYRLLKAMAYWTANPDQDSDGIVYMYATPGGPRNEGLERQTTVDIQPSSEEEILSTYPQANRGRPKTSVMEV